MKIWDRWRRWRMDEGRKMPAPGSVKTLREFVYLDEVSVYSLLASEQGMIDAEMTDAQASSLDAELSGSITASAGFVKGETASKVGAGQTHSTQVLRKALVQSTFKDLRSRVEDSFALRSVDTAGSLPTLSSWEESDGWPRDGFWITDAQSLIRGQLVELNVILESEPLFQARTVMSGVIDMIQDDPSFFGINDLGPIAETAVISRMLDRLLVGLVPLRARAVDYRVMQTPGGRELVVHTEVLQQFSDVDSRPLSVVGVAEEALFWKDIRRVVFSESNYSVLARVGRTSLQDTWTPLKLVDVLGRVVPGLSDALHVLNETVLVSLAEGAMAAEESGGALGRRALWIYAELLADHVGLEVSEAELEALGLLKGPIGLATDSPVGEWRAAFDPITSHIQSRSGSEIDRGMASRCRTAARVEAGVDQLNASQSTGGGPAASTREQGPSDRLLDAEIIAIYW